MFTLPPLPYAYDALEPHIDAETMRVHHDKHHQAYLNKFNAALKGYEKEFEHASVEQILSNLDAVPSEIRTAVCNNGGGYYHHSLFWEMMSPTGGGEPRGEIAQKLEDTFGSFETFKEQFTTVALSNFGSGWTWLVQDKKKQLAILSTPNQDSPVSQGFHILLGIDTWEHAYYLKYQNRRPEYVAAWWNVINWDTVNQRTI